MNKFVRNLITEWRRLELPVTGASAVVAVSGGADSAALLAAMCDLRDHGKLELRLIAAHFNHGLRGDASLADQNFVEKLTSEMGVDFVAGNARIQKRGNLEQNARISRYEFLRQTAVDARAGFVLTGHTMNDQTETFLLNLIRGSGLDGLAAMKAVRPLDEAGSGGETTGQLLVRPLLRWAKRSDTELFCGELSIEFRQDEMNEDQAFSRVRIRKSLIPMLEKFNPKIIDTLSSTAERIGELKQDEPDLVPGDTLALAELVKLRKPELYRVLRSWLRLKRGDLRGVELKHIEAIERLINSRKSGKTAELPGRQAVSKQSGRLVFKAIMVEK